MIDKIRAANRRYAMINDGDKVAVALSGGCDSVALLYALSGLRSEIDFELTAIHINHNLRGAESDRDEKFVRELCARMNVDMETESVDVKAEQIKSGDSTELCARRLRYECFDKLCARGFKVATAHTASDNAETVLFNLARGSGSKGMCGIPPKRDSYIRPLIMCTRDDTENYCAQNRLDYVTDSSNLTDDYSRNFIRHHVVPALKQINPNFDESVYRMSSRLTEIEAFIARMAEKAVADSLTQKGYSRDILLGLDKTVMSAALRLIAERETGICPDSYHSDELCAVLVQGGKVQLEGGFFADCGNYLSFNRGYQTTHEPFCLDLKEGLIDTPLFKLNVKINLTEKSQFVNKSVTQLWIDYDKIVGKAVVRNRKSGDVLRLKGRHTKPLRKLMNELQIPPAHRDSYPVIADDIGVICAVGVGVDERVLTDKSTKKMIIISEEGK